MSGHLVFETALGFVALAWSERGLTHLALPQTGRAAAERLTVKWTDAGGAMPENQVPDFVAKALSLIRDYAEGETVDFTTLPLDLEGMDAFRKAIYAAALKLSQGEVTTYGALAEQAGFPTMARETGQALGRNPLPLVIPCHRILAAGSRIGGFSAPGGAVTKQRMLEHEGVQLAPPPPAQASFSF